MKPTFWDYVRSAFNARPMGMFVPPNWIGLGVFGFLGLLNPGFWIIGLGLELAYLGRLATDSRFQRLVEGERLLGERRRWQERLADLIRELPAEDQQRYRALERRCGNIDRKSTRLNSSHSQISYAVFCLKKKTGIGESVEDPARILNVRVGQRRL